MTEYVVTGGIAIGVKDEDTGAINHWQYKAGERVELDDEAAKEYLADGAVRELTDEEKEADKESKSKSSGSGSSGGSSSKDKSG